MSQNLVGVKRGCGIILPLKNKIILVCDLKQKFRMMRMRMRMIMRRKNSEISAYFPH